MKHILILAQGLVAEEFVRIVNSKRIPDTAYTVVTPGEFAFPAKAQIPMERLSFDPTSYSKLRQLFNRQDFTMVFILLDTLEEAGESLKNIRRIDERIRVLLLDQWNAFGKLKQHSTEVFNSNEFLANHLYNRLPGVPVIARNVGLGEGEIMEVLVPFGSPFAYRHVGSIQQIKWRIAAIYRGGKLILPNNATMIRPQDILLLVGRPQVLSNLYHRIQRRTGMFPEPFGRHLYLFLDLCRDKGEALNYLEQALYLLERLKERDLIVRVVNPGDFELIRQIKAKASERVDLRIDYTAENISEVLTGDLQRFDIGLIFLSTASIKQEDLFEQVHDLKKLVYLFGATSLPELKRAVVLMGEQEEMEAISSTSFYVAETLELELCLCNFDPEGDFERGKAIEEHFENLSHIFHYPVKIEEKQVNPVRALAKMEGVLQITPFVRRLKRRWRLPFFSMDVEHYLLEGLEHPKLLVPVEMG
jgi:hypothetical protein